MGKKQNAPPTSNAFKAGAAQKMQPKPNPFELKVTKTKFDILNRHIKGAKGKPSESKTRSFEVRKKTLLPELKRRGRTGNLVDRRFGERNSALSMEEKMLERFSKERIRVNKKKAIFNLNNDNENYDGNDRGLEETLTLTHHGKNINDMKTFDSDPGEEDSDNDNYFSRGKGGGARGTLDSQIVENGHFGGPGLEGEGESKRTKAEIMQEVIAKSKMLKYERQRVKEENSALCEDLDSEFQTFRNVLEKRDPYKELPKEPLLDDYNEAVKMMAFDRRVYPSDRTKTAEESAAEAAEKLATNMKEKNKRMIDQVEPEFEPEFEDQAGEGPIRLGDDTLKMGTERELARVLENASQSLDEMLHSSSLEAANKAYAKLATLSRTNSVIQVAKVLRERMSRITDSINNLLKKGSAPVMPKKEVLLLFHFIGRVFSTSDYHHVVVTPAQLLICAYLEHGRLLKPRHLLSALFLIQTLLSFQRDSRRTCPEIFALLFPLLVKTFSLSIPNWIHFPTSRFMSRSTHEFLMRELKSCHPKPITFEDLEDKEHEEHLSKDMIAGFLLNLVKELVQIYETNVAAPELLCPLVSSLKGCPLIREIVIPWEENLLKIVKGRRRPLALQKFKPIAIPQLVPDLGEGLAPREEERKIRLERAYKRELKGAKREIRRDNAFLAQHKLQTRLDNDRKYQERIRQVIGSISNEGKSISGNGKTSFSKRPRK